MVVIGLEFSRTEDKGIEGVMASEAAIISWTPANWITIVLMVAVTYAVAGFIARAVQQSQQQKAG